MKIVLGGLDVTTQIKIDADIVAAMAQAGPFGRALEAESKMVGIPRTLVEQLHTIQSWRLGSSTQSSSNPATSGYA